MTVKFTRPSINIRETLDQLNKPSGIAGNAMLAADTPQEQFNLIGAGRKNLIINGAMQVSQRGDIDSSSAAAHLTYQIDRWRTVNNVAATIQRKVEQTLPTGERVNTLNITMSATGYAALQQRVEDYIYLRGKTVILSMWVKSNVRAGMSIYDGLSQPFAVPHSGNGEWEYITLAHSCPTNTSDMRAELWTKYPVSADAYIEIANVQLEVGSVATPFEHRSYGEELALCQRYYQKLGGGAYTPLGTGMIFGNIVRGATVEYAQTMRAVPSVISINNIMATDRTVYDNPIISYSATTAGIDKCSFNFNLTNTVSTSGYPTQICVKYSSVGYIEFDAEL